MHLDDMNWHDIDAIRKCKKHQSIHYMKMSNRKSMYDHLTPTKPKDYYGNLPTKERNKSREPNFLLATINHFTCIALDT